MTGKVVLSGDLSFNSLAEVFQILGGNNSTGVLRISSQYAPSDGIVYFIKGEPINGSDGSLNGLDAVYALFGRTEGKFEFLEENITVKKAIKKGRMEIVLDAMRMLDDGVIRKVGPPSFEQAPPLEEHQAGAGEGLSVLKGPPIDFLYVVDEEDFTDGRTVVKEGSHGKWLWVILDGMVKVTKETPKGPLTISHVGEGCFIGTFASFLFQEHARNASVTAVGEARLGLLDTQQLSVEFRALSPDLRSVLVSMDGRLRKITNRVGQLAEKRDAMTQLAKGKEVILKKGSTKTAAYRIAEGEGCLMGQARKGPFYLLPLEKNDFFGNLPFLNIGQEPKHAAVMAPKDLKAKKMDVESLQDEYDHLQGTIKSMVLSLNSSIAATTKMAFRLFEGK
jgi:CRP-like cAMP-binding protein